MLPTLAASRPLPPWNPGQGQPGCKQHSYARGASSLGAEGGRLNFCTDTWHVEAAEAAAEAAAAAAAVASATACAIRISDALFGANALACTATQLNIQRPVIQLAHRPLRWQLLPATLWAGSGRWHGETGYCTFTFARKTQGRRTFSCCTLPFSTSLSFKSASIRVSNSLFRSFCSPCIVDIQGDR